MSAERGVSDEPAVVLEAHDLTRHYPVSRRGLRRRQVVRAVDGVSLRLHAGETLGIVGESGSGKSTLARLLVALDRPTSGRLAIGGRDVFSQSARALRAMRRQIQFVMQDPYTALDPRMSVRAIIEEPFAIHREIPSRRDREAAVRALLDAVGLSRDHLDRYPHEFSGGQLQRIGIARALALRPRILVCDEPVSALDLSIQAQVINLLKDIQEQFGLSCIFIAHDLSVVRHVADRVAVMYLGTIVEQGDDEQVYDRPAHPYTQALQSASLRIDAKDDRSHRIVLSGEIPTALDPPVGCAFRSRCWKAEAVCATSTPSLELRTGVDHPCACHFADTAITPAAFTHAHRRRHEK